MTMGFTRRRRWRILKKGEEEEEEEIVDLLKRNSQNAASFSGRRQGEEGFALVSGLPGPKRVSGNCQKWAKATGRNCVAGPFMHES